MEGELLRLKGIQNGPKLDLTEKIPMIQLLAALLTFLPAAHAEDSRLATPPEIVKMIQTISVEERDARGEWHPYEGKAGAPERINLELHPFRKGDFRGFTANTKNNLTAGTLFRSEVRISRAAEPGSGHGIYAMLRSGPTLKRHGKIRSATIESLSKFSPLEIQDDPIRVHGKTLRARMRLEVAE